MNLKLKKKQESNNVVIKVFSALATGIVNIQMQSSDIRKLVLKMINHQVGCLLLLRKLSKVDLILIGLFVVK